MSKLTILVCGDRNWNDIIPIRRELLKRKKTADTVVHGGARGADTIAGLVAFNLGFTVRKEEAKWKKYGAGAGPIRNQLMLDKYNPDIVLAFHKDLKKSKGTKDMVTRARKAGTIVKVFKS